MFSDLARYCYLFPISDFPIPSLPCDIVLTFLRRYEFAVSTFPLAHLCASANINHRHSTCACVHIGFGLRAQPYVFPWRIQCANAEYRVVSPAPNQSLWYPFRRPLPRLLHAIVFVRECTCEMWPDHEQDPRSEDWRGRKIVTVSFRSSCR